MNPLGSPRMTKKHVFQVATQTAWCLQSRISERFLEELGDRRNVRGWRLRIWPKSV
jgi:hypothetical protein